MHKAARQRKQWPVYSSYSTQSRHIKIWVHYIQWRFRTHFHLDYSLAQSSNGSNILKIANNNQVLTLAQFSQSQGKPSIHIVWIKY